MDAWRKVVRLEVSDCHGDPRSMRSRVDADRLKLRVLRARERHPTLSRAELAKLVGCARSTVCRILDQACRRHRQWVEDVLRDTA